MRGRGKRELERGFDRTRVGLSRGVELSPGSADI